MRYAEKYLFQIIRFINLALHHLTSKIRLTWGRLNQYLSLEAAKDIAVAGG